jgi:hypothetical protein
MSENHNPNILPIMPPTPDSKTITTIDSNGKIRAVPIDPIPHNQFSTPTKDDSHSKRKVSTTDHSDKDVKRSRMAQQNGPSPPSPQGVGIMPGNIMTPNANNLL